MFCAVWCQIRKLSTRKSVNARAKTKPRGEARRERVGAKKGETKTQGANGNQRGSKIPPATPWVVQKGQYSWSTTLPNLVLPFSHTTLPEPNWLTKNPNAKTPKTRNKMTSGKRTKETDMWVQCNQVKTGHASFFRKRLDECHVMKPGCKNPVE